MAKLTLDNIGSAYGAIGALNANFQAIEEAFENTLSRDGTSPNYMESDLDLNSFDLLNVGSITTSGIILGGQQITPGTTFRVAGFTAKPIVTATAAQTAISVAPTVLAASSLVMVFVNGLKLPQSEVSFATSTVTVPALQAGDEVEVVEIKVG